ncbi:MAG: phosphotransferase family protein, partial [Gammaproteobacteria bacterium]|nr:phosphotransferase family protein [Gammaproteobacteria bacterium]
MEGINEREVTRWLSEHVAGGFKPPIEYTLIAGGHSNLTYRCRDANGKAVVLRRPPLGHVLESAHDMGREHRIISALADSRVPVAGTHGLCAGTDVNGAPFYVMTFVDGVVPHDAASVRAMPDNERLALGEHVADVLAALHAIDPDAVGLGDLGRKEAYLTRQLKRWTKQWQASKTDEIPAMEESCRLLEERMPVQVGAAIVHGDYRLGNMIVGDGRIRAVLDWELCTLGDPLADVGYLLNAWIEPGEVTGAAVEQAPTAMGG